MPPTSSNRQLLAGRAFHIAALAGLLAPLGACVSKGDECALTSEFGGVAVHGAVTIAQFADHSCSSDPASSASTSSSAASSGSGGGSPDVALEGIVRNEAGTIVVDSCPPNDTCAPMESVITLSGTDLRVSIPDGTFVQLHLYSKLFPDISSAFGCLWHVTVRNLPTWRGTPNPTSDGTFLWLAHHYTYQGDYSPPDDLYQTQREFVCRDEQIDTYAFRFSFPDAPHAEVFAPLGRTVTWSVPAGEHAGSIACAISRQ